MRYFIWLSLLLIAGCAPQAQDATVGSNAKPDPQPPNKVNKREESDPSPGLSKTFARSCFTLKYPAAWKVNEKDKEYDPDHFFIIEASSGAMILFDIVDELRDPSAVLSERMRLHGERLKTTAHKEFDTWGLYKGRGGELHGSAWGGSLRDSTGESYRAFVFNNGGKTFTVVESYSDKDEERLAPAYKAVEESFRVLQPEEKKEANGAVHDK
jgi:hypothetical protein